jgi:hypothetical protein
LQDEALDRTLCRTRFARGYGPVRSQKRHDDYNHDDDDDDDDDDEGGGGGGGGDCHTVSAFSFAYEMRIL